MGGGSANGMTGPPPPPVLKLCPKCNNSYPFEREHWYFRANNGNPMTPCRHCRDAVPEKTQHETDRGYVPVEKVYVLMQELVDRCGNYEQAAEASGIAAPTIKAITLRERPRVQKRIVRLLVLALSERRKFDKLNGASQRFIDARKRQALLEERIQNLTGY